MLRSVGIGDEAIVACRDTVGCWGWIKAYRDTDDPSFTEQDLELLGRVGPTLGSALRRRLGEGDVENLTAWFRTVVARVSLNILRARKAKREQPFDGRLPDPIVSPTDGSDPEHEALTSDSVGLALLVVLGTLPPAERLAFVLHDTFGVPFDEIALITGRSPAAARQLASRGRRRVRDQAPAPDPDLARQWELLDAFEAASREGDFEALVALLDPNIMLREDGGAGRESVVVRGARAVAERAASFAHLGPVGRRALVNGAAGVVVMPEGRPFAILAFTVADGRIVQIDVLADPARLGEIDLSAFQ